jgi:hypothetical protein
VEASVEIWLRSVNHFQKGELGRLCTSPARAALPRRECYLLSEAVARGPVFEMMREIRISALQTKAAMAFCEEVYSSWNGTWPNNRGTSAAIEKACGDIGLTSKQLKRQFAKVKAVRSGRGVRRRSEQGRTTYYQQLLDIIDDGGDIIDAAFDDAPQKNLLSLRSSNLARLSSVKDDVELRAGCLALLKGYAEASAKAWFQGSGAPQELEFSAHRRLVLRPRFKVVFERAFYEIEEEDKEDVWRLAVLFEGVLYKAYSDEVTPYKKPPLEVPGDDVEITLSSGQQETLCYIAGYMLESLRWRSLSYVVPRLSY